MRREDEENRNYTKKKPVFGRQCPKCKSNLRMLFFRNTKNNYFRSDIQLCPNGCRTADILTPIYPIEHSTLVATQKGMDQIQTLLSLNLLQLEVFEKKQLVINTNDQLLSKFFILDLHDSGAYLCKECFDIAYEKLQNDRKQTLIAIRPIKESKEHLCFICSVNQKKTNAELIIRVRSLEQESKGYVAI